MVVLIADDVPQQTNKHLNITLIICYGLKVFSQAGDTLPSKVNKIPGMTDF